ncbi:MAG: uncharacterized protein A8A55_0294 [Amphiamblys sp. WSBS2006]|nr:MAG: uncharacterized protein A8A55_0294 [Amphiamblys sp. WSBS2006]
MEAAVDVEIRRILRLRLTQEAAKKKEGPKAQGPKPRAVRSVKAEPVRKSPEKTRRINARKDVVRTDEEYNQAYAKIIKSYMEDPKEKWILFGAPIPSVQPQKERCRFVDDSLLITAEDAAEEFRLMVETAQSWPESDKRKFQEKVLLYEKDFHRVAGEFDGATLEDCVVFYYLHKKKMLLHRKKLSDKSQRLLM